MRHTSPIIIRPSPRNTLIGAAASVALIGLGVVAARNNGLVLPDPEAAALAAGEYLVRVTLPDGSFIYELDPIEADVSDSYNILRHAGTSYSMLELYKVTRDEGLLAAAERALAYLKRQTLPCPDIPEALCVVEGNEIKLGGNGLAILAFAKHAEVTGDHRYISTARQLSAWIVANQSPAGEFTKHKISASTGNRDDFVSGYYPGEALFALSRFSWLTGERRWIEAAHRGADWIINVRDTGKEASELESDHWFLYTLNELHADRPEELYVQQAQKITDRIVSDQHSGLRGDKREWNGGYGDPPRSTPAATRSEGLGAAIQLFRRAGNTVYEEKATHAFERGIEFQLRTQMMPAKAKALAADPISIGGFHESLHQYGIRIDYVQHNLSALLAYKRVIEDVSE